MSEREWLDKADLLLASWQARCDLVRPTIHRYQLSRSIWEAVWILWEWDLQILRQCEVDHKNWLVFEAHHRLKVEGIIRGYWIEECAEDEQIIKLLNIDLTSSDVHQLRIKMQGHFPRLPAMLKQLERYDVPWIKGKSARFHQLYESGNETAHMSVLLAQGHRIQRAIRPSIRHCVAEVGLCAMRIARISLDAGPAS